MEVLAGLRLDEAVSYCNLIAKIGVSNGRDVRGLVLLSWLVSNLDADAETRDLGEVYHF